MHLKSGHCRNGAQLVTYPQAATTHSAGHPKHVTGEADLDNIGIAEDSSDSQHSLRSMLAGRPAQAELELETTRQPCFRIRAADSTRERRSVNSLVDRMYATRGYETTSLPDEDSPCRKTFLASDHNVAVGTLTIGFDSTDGLLADELFAEEVGRLRKANLKICEFTKLAMDRRARSPRLLASIFHVAYIYAHRIKVLHNLLIEVNPRHVRYYEAMLGFKVIGAERHNLRVNAPAVLLSLDLCYAEEQIHRFGGRSELSGIERSAYPYFFSANDEAGIIDRLHRADEDIAHVFEIAPNRTVAPQANGRLH